MQLVILHNNYSSILSPRRISSVWWAVIGVAITFITFSRRFAIEETICWVRTCAIIWISWCRTRIWCGWFIARKHLGSRRIRELRCSTNVSLDNIIRITNCRLSKGRIARLISEFFSVREFKGSIFSRFYNSWFDGSCAPGVVWFVFSNSSEIISVSSHLFWLSCSKTRIKTASILWFTLDDFSTSPWGIIGRSLCFVWI